MTAWRIEPAGGDTFAVATASGAVSRSAFVAALADDPALRGAVTEVLRASRYPAFAWEMPALAAETAERAAAFAIVDSPQLARVTPDPAPFAAQLAAGARVATFANLGGDAVLVVPSPAAAPGAAHLAAFVRGAPADVVDELWAAVGRAIAARRAARPAPVWVSTAGLGVHWLHVRLDDRPKYYRHRPYTDASA
jgi:hypothetical protein